MAEVIVKKDTRKYRTIITDIGHAKIAQAVLDGTKVDIVTAAVTDGKGRYFEPTADMVELPNEVWRGTIADKAINPASRNMLDIRIFLDGSVGGFTARGIGLVDDAGDLIAVCNIPDTEKAQMVNGVAATLTLIMHILVTNIEVLEFKLDPSVDTVSSAEMQASIKQHNANPEAHADLRTAIAQMVTVSDAPPAYNHSIWLCADRTWRPPKTTVLTAKLGEPGDKDEDRDGITVKVDNTQYPVVNATLETDGENLIAAIIQ